MNKKDKLLTLANGRQFVVIEQCEYNGKLYYFTNEIVNNNTSEIFKIFSIKIENDVEIVENITDDDIIKAVCEILDKKTDNDF